MKKILLVSFLMLFVAIALAHEAVMKAPLIVPEDQADEDGGWFVKYFSLDWSKKDDHCVSFNITNAILGEDPGVEVSRAWKQVPVLPHFDIRFGKDQYAFGRITTGKPSKHLQIFDLFNAPAEMMVKLVGKNAPIGWQLYYANKDFGDMKWDAADYGVRVTKSIDGFNLGASIRMDYTSESITEIDTLTNEPIIEGWEDPESVMHWEIDAEYIALEKIGIDIQIQNYDYDEDDTNEMNFYSLLYYQPGIMVPIAGQMTPYFGYITKNEILSEDEDGIEYGKSMKEYDMFFGANFKPKENAFIKLEYHMDSVDDTDDELNLQQDFHFSQKHPYLTYCV